MTIKHVFDAFNVNQIDAMSDDAHATRIPGGTTFVVDSSSPGLKSLRDTLDGLAPASRVDHERRTVGVDVERLSPCLNIDSSRHAGGDPRAGFIKPHQTHSTDQPAMKDRKQAAIQRLARLEGQVRGVARMIEEDRYCIDILNQSLAIRSALSQVEILILQDHADDCVDNAILSQDPDVQRRKFKELVEVFEKVCR